MIDLVDEQLLNFVVENTKHFDGSHNHVHALKVTHNAHVIMKSIKDTYDERLLTCVAMLHDVCDHKYPESIPKEKLSDFIKLYLSPMMEPIAMKIIDNVSFSKEDNGLQENLPEPYNMYLKALTDADRLEALGQVGIDRCIEFTRSHGGTIPQDVVKHCHDKLLRLLPEFFIKTDLGRQLAIPLHDEIYKYVDKNS
jgi:uncharacterized protein